MTDRYAEYERHASIPGAAVSRYWRQNRCWDDQEDMVQEARLKVWQALGRVRSSHSPAPLLRHAAGKAAVGVLAARRACLGAWTDFDTLSPEVRLYDARETPEAHAVRGDLERRAINALESVPPLARWVLVRRYLDGARVTDIQAELEPLLPVPGPRGVFGDHYRLTLEIIESSLACAREAAGG